MRLSASDVDSLKSVSVPVQCAKRNILPTISSASSGAGKGALGLVKGIGTSSRAATDADGYVQ